MGEYETAGRIGQIIGDFAGIATGIMTGNSGSGAAASGVAATTVIEPGGVAIVVGGEAVAVYGYGVAGVSAVHLAQDLSLLFSASGGGTSTSNSGSPQGGPKLKSFTKKNFRRNLKVSTGMDPGPDFQAHHVFPQKFKRLFNRLGIEIHNPLFGEWWGTGPGTGHQG